MWDWYIDLNYFFLMIICMMDGGMGYNKRKFVNLLWKCIICILCIVYVSDYIIIYCWYKFKEILLILFEIFK